MTLIVGTLDAIGAARRRGMFALRHRVFKERLRWSVASHQGLESDPFDNPQAMYVIDEDSPSCVKGCMRLLPTTGPYMLAQVFPELLGQASAPCRPDVWEISRFAFDKSAYLAHCHWGFSFRVLDILAEAVSFALAQGVRRYVFATSVAVQRLMAAQGLNACCMGPVRRVGQVESVAMALEVDPITLQALGQPCGAAPALRDAGRNRPHGEKSLSLVAARGAWHAMLKLRGT
jgi:acyl homoserine lactone synthase